MNLNVLVKIVQLMVVLDLVANDDDFHAQMQYHAILDAIRDGWDEVGCG